MRLPFNSSYPITQEFGFRPEYYAKYGVKGHNGIDYGLPNGTEIVAPHDGQILEAAFDTGYGWYIKVENENEGSVLAHLQEIHVKIGFSVKEGQVLGKSDNSGDSSGPHLHWGYYTKPRNRANGYNGYVDQKSLVHKPDQTFTYEYSLGEIIEPDVFIPVGEAPGKERFEYGKVGPKYPGKIVDIKQGYYNIDQRAIGGGTGWVKAELVDLAAVFNSDPIPAPSESKPEPTPQVAPPTPSVPPVKTYSEAEYNAILKDRDDVLSAKQEVDRELTRIRGIYSGFEALGYSTPDDITKLINQKDETIIGINKQLAEVLKRNQKLAQMVQDKENEDSTAIDEGLKAMEELKEVRDAITLIARETDTKPTVFDIIEKVGSLRKQAEKFVTKAKEEYESAKEKQQKESPKNGEPRKFGITYLLSIFGLKGGERT